LSKLKPQFRKDFQSRNAPTRFAIKRLLDKFKEAGNVQDNIKGRSGRPRSVRTENHIVTVRQCLKKSPRKSRRSLPLDIFQKVQFAHNAPNLDLFPYRRQASKVERRAFGQTISQRTDEDLVFWTSFFQRRGNFPS